MERRAGNIFQTVIFQRVHPVIVSKNICAQINNKLELWNIIASAKLLDKSYAASVGYLGISHGNKNAEQCHCMFLNLVLHEKLRDAVTFVLIMGNRGIFLTRVTGDQ